MIWLALTLVLAVYILLKPGRGIYLTCVIIPLINYEVILPGLPIPLTFEKIIIPVIVLKFIYSGIKHGTLKDSFTRNGLQYYVLVYWVINLLSFLIAGRTLTGSLEFIEETTYLLFIFAALDFFNKFKENQKLSKFLLNIIFVSGVVSVIGILQLLVKTDFLFNSETVNSYLKYGLIMKGRISSTIGHPNFLAAYLLLIISITVPFISSSNPSRTKCLLKIILFLNIISLILTFSKIGAIAFLFFIIRWLFHKRTRKISIVILLIISFGLVTFVKSKYYNDYRWRMRSSTYTSIKYRILLYRAEYHIVKNHIWFGSGIGNYQHLIKQFIKENPLKFSEGEIIVMSKKIDISTAHNSYFKIIFKSGIIGLAVFIILLARVFQLVIRKTPGAWTGVLLGLTGVLICALTDEILSFSKIQFLFWMLGVAHISTSGSQIRYKLFDFKEWKNPLTNINNDIIHILLVICLLLLFPNSLTLKFLAWSGISIILLLRRNVSLFIFSLLLPFDILGSIKLVEYGITLKPHQIFICLVLFINFIGAEDIRKNIFHHLKFIIKNKFTFVFFGFILSLFIPVLYSQNSYATLLNGIKFLLLYFSFYYILVSLRTEKDFLNLQKGILFSSIIIIGVCFYQITHGIFVKNELTGGFEGGYAFSDYIIFIILFYTSLISTRASNKKGVLILSSLVVIFYLYFLRLTLHLGAVLGLIGGSFLYFSLYFRRGDHLKKIYKPAVTVLLFLLIVFFRQILSYTITLLSDPSFIWRINLWITECLPIFLSHPIFGNGANSLFIPVYYYSYMPAHSNLIDIALTGGIFSLLLYTGFIGLLFFEFFNKEKNSKRGIFYSLGVISGIGAGFIHGLTSSTLIYFHHWFFYALAIFLIRLDDNDA